MTKGCANVVLPVNVVMAVNVKDVKVSASAPGLVSKILYVLLRHEISISVIRES